MKRFDSYGASEKFPYHQNNEDYLCLDDDRSVFIVADGMGGMPAGELASSMAARVFLEYMLRIQPDSFLEEEYLTKAVQAANVAIRSFVEENREKEGMGTTLTAAILNGSDGKFVHIGDSRIYLFRENSLSQLTSDHTLVAELVAKNVLAPLEAEHYPLRHVLSMAVGTRECMVPDIRGFSVQRNDWLILTTDGLAKSVSDNVLEKLMIDNSTLDAEGMGRAIMNKTTESELQDDVSIIVIKVL